MSEKLRENRLRRSFRRSPAVEKDASFGHRPDLKTPSRSRPSAGFCGESPHNESGDFQQDIIWDSASPSPRRLGKRGRRVGAVNISDIVSRIAPEHGRPRIVEPTLQQWIGDSAAIPCTPDVQPPKPKKKSPRPNGVDDLLKLAKQFDFNMLHEEHDRSLELLSDKDDDEVVPVAVKAQDLAQKPLDCFSDEDFDFMFDGSTQNVSEALSQGLSAQKTSQDVSENSTGKPSVDLSGTKRIQNMKNSANTFSTTLHQHPAQNLQVVQSSAINISSNGYRSRSEQNLTKEPELKSSNGSSATNPNEHLQKNPASVQSLDCEDDWDDDGLMDDSLLIEMTQNPHIFTPPKRTSTQKNTPGFKTEKTRQTFALSANTNFSANFSLEKEMDFKENFSTASATSKTVLDRNKFNYNTATKTSVKDYSNPAFVERTMSRFAKSSNSNDARTQQNVSNKASLEGFSGIKQTLPSFTNTIQSVSKPHNDLSTRPHQDKAQSATVNVFRTSLNASRNRSHSTQATNRSESFRLSSATTHKVENGTKSSQIQATTSQIFIKTLQMDVQTNSTTASATRMSQNITSSNGSVTRSESFSNNNSSFNIKNTTTATKNLLNAPSSNPLATRLEQNPRSKPLTSVSSNGSDPKMVQNIKNPRIKSVNAENNYPTDPGLSSSNVSPDFFEDLDSIFSSEPLWDDPADDDLLYELCDDVENQIQKDVKASERPPFGQRSNQALGENRVPTALIIRE